MVADVNGDEKSDIIHSLDETSGGFHSLHTIYYSIGIGTVDPNPILAFIPESFTRPESISFSIKFSVHNFY